jgi:hypothetical protein
LGADKAAPLAICSDVPSSFGMQVANVVLPNPGGPSSRMCPSTSPRLRVASTAIDSRSKTARCPTISLNRCGRSARSSAAGSSMAWIEGSRKLVMVAVRALVSGGGTRAD